MALSLYDFSVPIFIRGLKNLSYVLKKGEEYADEKGIPHDDFLNASLAPDMKPLTFQVQTASNTAKNTLVRVADSASQPLEDNETTFAELQSRIAKTLEILNDNKKEQWQGTEGKEVLLKLPNTELKFDGLSYVQGFALPNFFFHVTTAYAILRSKGVPLGKADYLRGGQSIP